MPIISEIEIHKVKEYLVLTCASITLDKDIKAIENSELIIKALYAQDLRNVQDRINAEIIALRKVLKQLGIKIVEETRSPHAGLKAEYICRGYERNISMLPAIIRARVLKAIAKYKNIDLTGAAT